MTFVFNELGFQHVFLSEGGPVGQRVQEIAKAVVEEARQNFVFTSNPEYPHDGLPYAISMDLLSQLDYQMDENLEQGAIAFIGSPVQHRGFAYPRELETGGASVYGTRFAWLSKACIDLGLDYRPLI